MSFLCFCFCCTIVLWIPDQFGTHTVPVVHSRPEPDIQSHPRYHKEGTAIVHTPHSSQ